MTLGLGQLKSIQVFFLHFYETVFYGMNAFSPCWHGLWALCILEDKWEVQRMWCSNLMKKGVFIQKKKEQNKDNCREQTTSTG